MPIPRPRTAPSAFALAAIFLVAAAPSAFAKPRIADFTVGFGGTFASGVWTPLRVLVENQPDPARPTARMSDVRGRLRLTVRDLEDRAVRFVRDVDLPRNSRKIVELPVQLPDHATVVSLELLDAGRGVLDRRDLSSVYKTGANGRNDLFVEPTILLESTPDENAVYPGWVGDEANVQRVALEELPADARAYGETRVLVLRRAPGGTLSEEQLAALDRWIAFGGRLVVSTPRAYAEMKADPWLAERLPARIDDVRAATLTELGPDAPDEAIELTRWAETVPDAISLWDGPDGPVAIERPHGMGKIVALAVDPSGFRATSLRSSPGLRLQAILESVALAPAVEDLRGRHNWSTGNVAGGFEGVTLLPNKWIVALMLIGFVVVVGPGNFVALKRAGRLELAWVTIPGLSILFFAAVYLYGAKAKGDLQIVTRSEIVHVPTGRDEGLALWTSAQFSPASRDYRLSAPGDAAVVPLMRLYEPPALYNQTLFGAFGVAPKADFGEPADAIHRASGGYELVRPVEQWRMAFYQGERVLPLGGVVDGRVVVGSSVAPRLEFRNGTGATLSDAILYVGELAYPVGTIGPGETVDRELAGGTREPALAEHAAALARQGGFGFPGNRAPDDTYDPGHAEFEKNAAAWIRAGAFIKPPVHPKLRPQRRTRLVAVQEDWTAEVEMAPRPDRVRGASLVEVELPMAVEGGASFQSVGGAGGLTVAVAGYDPSEVRFFDNTPNLCSVEKGWVEFLLAPPRLDGPARFADGWIEVTAQVFSGDLTMDFFDYAAGAWREVGFAPDAQGKDRRPIPAEAVNPVGLHARLRLRGIEESAAQRRQGGQAIQGGGWMSSGISVLAVDAGLSLAPL